MLLFCVKTVMIDSHNFELTHLKKNRKKHFGRLAPFWFGIFMMSFHATRSLVGRKTLEDE